MSSHITDFSYSLKYVQGLPVLILPFPLLNGLFYFDFFFFTSKEIPEIHGSNWNM